MYSMREKSTRVVTRVKKNNVPLYTHNITPHFKHLEGGTKNVRGKHTCFVCTCKRRQSSGWGQNDSQLLCCDVCQHQDSVHIRGWDFISGETLRQEHARTGPPALHRWVYTNTQTYIATHTQTRTHGHTRIEVWMNIQTH
mgnify:CR=1 FL=1